MSISTWSARALGVVLAHSVTGLPYVVLTVSASLSNLDPRLEQAARGLGASLGQTLRYVIVPNIVPGVLSGAIFAFIHSWDELVVVHLHRRAMRCSHCRAACGTASTTISIP